MFRGSRNDRDKRNGWNERMQNAETDAPSHCILFFWRHLEHTKIGTSRIRDLYISTCLSFSSFFSLSSPLSVTPASKQACAYMNKTVHVHVQVHYDLPQTLFSSTIDTSSLLFFLKKNGWWKKSGGVE
ncbi:hypothetical protein AA313_de0208467 [Arthrobotrys entomopaga]|nr:hypothetical protein AA313_de0208467 [Arthrobotrys entomopaga]